MIGLGIMGSAMSKNLIAAGFNVFGYDIAPRAIKAFKALGGAAAASIAEVGKAASILITSLPSAKALSDVVGELRTLAGGDRVAAETSTFTLEDKLAAHALPS